MHRLVIEISAGDRWRRRELRGPETKLRRNKDTAKDGSMSSHKRKTAPGGDVEHSLKRCFDVLKQLQRNPRASAFMMPVDWKVLKLPMYPKLIKHPMDLGTVQAKLDMSCYNTVSDFAADVRLVWSNALRFNVEGSDIYDAAMIMQNEFDAKMTDVRSGPLRETAGNTTASGGSGSGRLFSSAGALCGEALAGCKGVVREMRKHKDAQVFLEPVDWKVLGIKDYPTIIKRPMDLGTVMKRLDTGHYTSALDVAADVDLVWNNAMTYNQDHSYIYQAAAGLKVLQPFQVVSELELRWLAARRCCRCSRTARWPPWWQLREKQVSHRMS